MPVTLLHSPFVFHLNVFNFTYLLNRNKWFMKLWGTYLKTQGKYPLWLFTLSSFHHKNNNGYCSMEPQDPRKTSGTKCSSPAKTVTLGLFENLPTPPTTPIPGPTPSTSNARKQTQGLADGARALPELCHIPGNPKLTSRSTSSLLSLWRARVTGTPTISSSLRTFLLNRL